MFFALFFPVCVLVGAFGLAIESTEVFVRFVEVCLRALEADLIQWNDEEEQSTVQME